MKESLPAEKFYHLLKHRPPMTWVESVISAREEEGQFFGECQVSLSKTALYLQGGTGGPSGASAIEFCAQAYGFSRACYQEMNNIDFNPTQTYLSSISRCKTSFHGFDPEAEDHLRIKVQTKRVTHPLVFINGQVYGSSGRLYAELSFALYLA